MGGAISTDTIYDYKAFDIPNTLQGVIAARIDRLSANNKYTLQTAAVIGRVFQNPVLKYLLSQEQVSIHLDEALDELQRHGFIRQQEAFAGDRVFADMEYIFKHVLTQEMAYKSLLISQRKRLHRIVGEAIEALFPELMEENAATLAYHFERAEVLDKALAYLHRAGERATRLSANEEAVGHFRRGLALLNNLPDTPERTRQELTLQVSLAVALTTYKGYADIEAGQAYNRAYHLCNQIGQTRQIRTVIGLLGGFYLVKAEYDLALEFAQQLLSLALKKKGARLMVLVGNYLQATSLAYKGELEPSLKHAEQAVSNYNPRLHRAMILSSNFNLGVTSRCSAAFSLQLLGFIDQSRSELNKALAMAQGVAHPFSLAYALSHSAFIAQLRHDVHTTKGNAEEVLAISLEYGNPVFTAMGTISQGWATAMLGQVAEGLAQIRQGMTMYRATGSEYLLSGFFTMLAEVSKKAGQYEEGLEALSDGTSFVSSTGERFYEAEIHRLKGELLLLQGANVVEVERHYQKAIKVARHLSEITLELRATISLVRLWQNSSNYGEAWRMLEKIYSRFTEGFDTADLQEAKRLIEEPPNN